MVPVLCRRGVPRSTQSGWMGDPFESIEARIKLLRPAPGTEPQAMPPLPTTPQAKSAASGSRAPPAYVFTRSDAPVVRHARRGSITLATEAMQQQGVDTLIGDLMEDRLARSTTGPMSSLVKTWARFHHLAFAADTFETPVLPLTPRSLVAAGSLFKKGGYRSFANYISAMKGRHIEEGFFWTQLLSHTANWVTRSVTRGIGPARQSCGFNFVKLCRLPRTSEPLVVDGPQHAVVMALLASLFLLREIEVSTARTDAWSLDYEAMELKWNLPASKSDHMALGVARSWPCLCDLTNAACPFHLAVDHLAWIRRQANYREGVASPLFPTIAGQHAAKRTVVDSFEL